MIAGLEILNLHAQGGMAEVFRARGKGSDGKFWFYAVKRILPAMTQNETLLEMFIEEARVASMLVHPNIVRVYDLTRSETGDYYIVMEFLEGKDVAEVIGEAMERGRILPLWLAVHVAREILQALVYANSQATDANGQLLGLIHRDISPPNIFLCSDGQVKLTDFGVAKVAQSQVMTQVGITKGKFGYMSPEQVSGETLDGRSDLYNVGILLYEMITGRRLFMAETAAEFLSSMLKAEVPPIERSFGLPYELEALLRRSLSRDRSARPESAAAFLAELSRIATRERLVVTRANVAEELRVLFSEHTQARAAAAVPSVTSEMSVPAPRAPAQPMQPMQSAPRFTPEDAPAIRPPMRAPPSDTPTARPAARPLPTEPPPPRPPTRAPSLEPPRPPTRAPVAESPPVHPPVRVVAEDPPRPARVATRSSHRAIPLQEPLPELPSRPEPTMAIAAPTFAERPEPTVAVAPPSLVKPPRAPPMVDRPERPPTKKVQVAEPGSAATPRPSPVRPGTKQVRLLPDDEAPAEPASSSMERPKRATVAAAAEPASSSMERPARATVAPVAPPPEDDPVTVPPEATAIQLGLRDKVGKASVKGSKRVVPIEGGPKK